MRMRAASKPSTILASLVVILITVAGKYGYAETTDLKKYTENNISIDLGMAVSAQPGSKPVTLNQELVARIVPELETPRFMRFSDIPEPEQLPFIEEGYAYVLKGDFNVDGYADLAFVGKYSEEKNIQKSFFTIISFRPMGILLRELLLKIERENIFLMKIPDSNIKGGKIGLIYKSSSEECGSIFWQDGTYWYEDCVNSTSFDVPGLQK